MIPKKPVPDGIRDGEPVSRLREAMVRWLPFLIASAGEGRSDKIMRKIAHDPEKWEPVSG